MHDGYVGIYIDGKTHRFHRVLFKGLIPANQSVDHIDRDKLNNRRSNLRYASKRLQALNKVGRKEKLLPPGVHSRPTGYRVTWTSGIMMLRGSGNRADLTDRADPSDTSTPAKEECLYVTAAKYGRKGALKVAMATRMMKMISTADHLDALFPIHLINGALAEKGAPLLTSTASPAIIGIALETLNKLGYNLWNIPYGGQFAHYMEKEDWSFKDTRKYVLKSISDVLDRLEGCLVSEELKEECLAVECDVRALNYLYTVARRKEEHRRKELARELIPRFKRIDSALQELRTDILPSEVEAPKPQPEVKEAIQQAKATMQTVSRSDRETIKDATRPEKLADPSTEAEASMAAVMEKATKLIKSGDAEYVQKAMQSALRIMERREKAEMRDDMADEKKPRVYKISAESEAWVREHLQRTEGQMLLATDIILAHNQWMRSHGIKKPDGPLKVSSLIKQAGFASGMKKMIFNCSLS